MVIFSASKPPFMEDFKSNTENLQLLVSCLVFRENCIFSPCSTAFFLNPEATSHSPRGQLCCSVTTAGLWIINIACNGIIL